MTHLCGEESKRFVQEIGGKDKLVSMCNRFYQKFFIDSHLDQFMFDKTEPHGQRLGLWMAEKMTGERSWSLIRHRDSRSMAHAKAWSCPKRQERDIGRRFKLPDCRVWMRLMFWAAREEGLDKHEKFFRFFYKFIQSFIGVYERTAPPYTRDSMEWSLSHKEVDTYIRDGRVMKDVLGLHVR
eukprot:TRINITY_DN7508_c0_g1_i1.p1 TRINITY_DN7508_c0_g1~~TRINITY_DN7508_c0_g1_i1.p1  ORF type:complete len:202 (+),score=35.25 TRINITY_DN7508_c0_g1_i1:62-607(+)